ncbi:MAG: DUF2851 family protein [Dehalococcoidia bacterium]
MTLSSSPVPLLSPASEAELSAVWAGQLFRRRSLVTEGGGPVRVVYRGLAGAGPGPDFRDAIIAGPGGPRHGDVELHVREGDFRRHGHHLDPGYGNVVLHVVFDAEGAAWSALPGGGSAPVLVLPRIAARARSWQPARAWAEPCATATGRLGGEIVLATLDRLGEMRFRQKAHAVRTRLTAGEEPDDLVWELLLEGLAYGGDRAAFRALGERLPWAALGRELRVLAEPDRVAAALGMLAALLSGVSLDARAPRPGNRPEARLAGAAVLAARFAANGPARALLAFVTLPPERAAVALIASLTVPRLIGRARAIELVANAFLPLAAAQATELAEEAQAEAVYGALPLPARYGAVRHLHRAVTPLRLNTRRQQGMLYLLKQYCTQGGCGRCPLS